MLGAAWVGHNDQEKPSTKNEIVCPKDSRNNWVANPGLELSTPLLCPILQGYIPVHPSKQVSRFLLTQESRKSFLLLTLIECGLGCISSLSPCLSICTRRVRNESYIKKVKGQPQNGKEYLLIVCLIRLYPEHIKNSYNSGIKRQMTPLRWTSESGRSKLSHFFVDGFP